MRGAPGLDRMLLFHHGAWFQTITGVIATAIALLPVLPIAAWALARLRRRSPHRWRTAIIDVGLVYGTVIPIWLTMVPGGNHAVSLVPFRDLATMSRFQIVGNLLLLSVPAFLAPIRFRALASLPRITLLMAALSCAIETCQYLLPIGRIASVDDVMVNSAGAALAALLSRPWWSGHRVRGGLIGHAEPEGGGRLGDFADSTAAS
ncbi:MAG: VanZ family protein [Marmoricola sp.]